MAAQVQEDNSTANITNWFKTVEHLRHSTDWSEDERPIELIQTHISVVLLSRRHALKLKKPVDFGFLDYTTLEKRLAACEAEIALNRRLCAVHISRRSADHRSERRTPFKGRRTHY